jgi:hypothetical protein
MIILILALVKKGFCIAKVCKNNIKEFELLIQFNIYLVLDVIIYSLFIKLSYKKAVENNSNHTQVRYSVYPFHIKNTYKKITSIFLVLLT